jgi:hypothetical protein
MEPAAKKRKLQNGDAAARPAPVADLTADVPLHFSMQDVSFAIPQRKKLALEVTAAGGYVRARNQSSKAIEFGIAMGKIRPSPKLAPTSNCAVLLINAFP